jgi:hypothetical protein
VFAHKEKEVEMDHPMLFCQWEVSKILEWDFGLGNMQTRRALTQQPLDVLPMNVPHLWATLETRDPNHGRIIRCRYGVPGDRLWVREKWKIASFMAGEPIEFQYQDGTCQEENQYADCPEYDEWYERVCIQSTDWLNDHKWPKKDEDGIYSWERGHSPLPWRPAIHMPRWAFRIWLEMVSVRLEKLQEITSKDILAEGIPLPVLPGGMIGYELATKPFPLSHYVDKNPDRWDQGDYLRAYFAHLWDSLNAERGYGWDTNPYVWAIEFKKIEKKKD